MEQIGWATSANGVNFTENAHNPVAAQVGGPPRLQNTFAVNHPIRDSLAASLSPRVPPSQTDPARTTAQHDSTPLTSAMAEGHVWFEDASQMIYGPGAPGADKCHQRFPS